MPYYECPPYRSPSDDPLFDTIYRGVKRPLSPQVERRETRARTAARHEGGAAVPTAVEGMQPDPAGASVGAGG